jgi:HAMP domain-containing protein
MKIRFSIKSKLILAISGLMAVIFLIVGFLFVNEKKIELADDIYVGVRSFAELSAPEVARLSDLYLEQEGFVYFNRGVRQLMQQNRDVSSLKITSYSGEVLYDSFVDIDKKYEGDVRGVEDRLLGQIKSENSSIFVEDGTIGGGDIYYLKKDLEGGYEYVNVNEGSILEPETGFRFLYFVQPASDKYSVVYGVTYEHMNARVADMLMRIIYTAVFGFLLGIVLSVIMSMQVTKPVRKLVAGAEEVAKGNLKTRVNVGTSDEIGYLGESFNKMTEDLEKSFAARLYKERVGKELELARKIQDEIIPKVVPELDGLDVAAGILPATEVGGDMYDFIPVAGGATVMYLGDVTGHGVPASMIGAVANSLFYSYSGVGNLKEIVVNANRILKKKTTATMFMTLAMLKWDPSKGLSYVNAGHDPVLHYSKASGQIVEGTKGGLAVGMVADISAQVQEVSLALESGDFVVVYSDGVPEAWKSEKEQYGMERFKESLKKFGPLGTAEEIKNAIFADLKSFCGDFEQKDDITVMVLRKS